MAAADMLKSAQEQTQAASTEYAGTIAAEEAALQEKEKAEQES